MHSFIIRNCAFVSVLSQIVAKFVKIACLLLYDHIAVTILNTDIDIKKHFKVCAKDIVTSGDCDCCRFSSTKHEKLY